MMLHHQMFFSLIPKTPFLEKSLVSLYGSQLVYSMLLWPNTVIGFCCSLPKTPHGRKEQWNQVFWTILDRLLFSETGLGCWLGIQVIYLYEKKFPLTPIVKLSRIYFYPVSWILFLPSIHLLHFFLLSGSVRLTLSPACDGGIYTYPISGVGHFVNPKTPSAGFLLMTPLPDHRGVISRSLNYRPAWQNDISLSSF